MGIVCKRFETTSFVRARRYDTHNQHRHDENADGLACAEHVRPSDLSPGRTAKLNYYYDDSVNDGARALFWILHRGPWNADDFDETAMAKIQKRPSRPSPLCGRRRSWPRRCTPGCIRADRR